jgi:hypothetical protein
LRVTVDWSTAPLNRLHFQRGSLRIAGLAVCFRATFRIVKHQRRFKVA